VLEDGMCNVDTSRELSEQKHPTPTPSPAPTLHVIPTSHRIPYFEFDYKRGVAKVF
jgi:hypothetical protein